ncbi:cation efflux family protein, putative [Talaromyces stipitatus ATCC 10500]|uniref:Cation efflux family protein, putative n=1 Tax=Talaromyces stipitatus (strain ATCC 10500 / CBS 375.48 / QM 6759 / NRRL 1006) TaxID=441959 RepID=B8MFP0_TALSN|nr:cation efflux family protein, putative [Talaromyces stipitatus ATCC 10500]EED17030.1 cation efflux family protein, putative [Talaromyces stipitatus ATCC 10500]
MTVQTRGHAGHHGHHHHHHDNVYLTSSNKKDAGVRITRIGLFVNLAMAIGKFVGGYIFHSQALIADAYHALTDLVSDFMTLGTVAWSLKPPSERFPNGYGKVESLGALGVSSLLLCGGVFMGLDATQALLSQFVPEAFEALGHAGLLFHGHSHSHDHGAEVLGPNINAIWLAAGSIVAKEWLYRATMKIAQERKSSVLASNAVHHRIDSLTSLVALATIGGAHIFTNAAWLDPVGGLIISLMVINAGWTNTKSALLELADTTVDEEIKESVQAAALKTLAQSSTSTQGIEIRDVQGLKSGQNYLVDVEVGVKGSMTVQQSREIEEIVRTGIGAKVRGVRRVKVRFVPAEIEGVDFAEEFIPGDVSPRMSPEPEKHDHDHDHTHEHQHNGSGQSDVHKRR